MLLGLLAVLICWGAPPASAGDSTRVAAAQSAALKIRQDWVSALDGVLDRFIEGHGCEVNLLLGSPQDAGLKTLRQSLLKSRQNLSAPIQQPERIGAQTVAVLEAIQRAENPVHSVQDIASTLIWSSSIRDKVLSGQSSSDIMMRQCPEIQALLQNPARFQFHMPHFELLVRQMRAELEGLEQALVAEDNKGVHAEHVQSLRQSFDRWIAVGHYPYMEVLVSQLWLYWLRDQAAYPTNSSFVATLGTVNIFNFVGVISAAPRFLALPFSESLDVIDFNFVMPHPIGLLGHVKGPRRYAKGFSVRDNLSWVAHDWGHAMTALKDLNASVGAGVGVASSQAENVVIDFYTRLGESSLSIEEKFLAEALLFWLHHEGLGFRFQYPALSRGHNLSFLGRFLFKFQSDNDNDNDKKPLHQFLRHRFKDSLFEQDETITAYYCAQKPLGCDRYFEPFDRTQIHRWYLNAAMWVFHFLEGTHSSTSR